MQDYEKLLALANAPEVKEGVELPKLKLHKWLVLGQTEYLCKYGTLGDGHEKFIASQVYPQALKEKYYLALNIQAQKAVGMEAQADLLDAEAEFEAATGESGKLRAQAKIERAKAQLLSALTTIEDQTRMVLFYSRVIAELGPKVEEQYPGGIEQAERDNWRAVAEYRRAVESTPGMQRQLMSNVPLDPITKATLGMEWNRPDMFAPLAVSSPEAFEQLANTHSLTAITHKDQKVLEKK